MTRFQEHIARLSRSSWARLVPFLLLGPISGPLAAGALFNFRGGRPVLGSLYSVALTLFYVDLPLASAKILPLVHHLK